MLIHESCLQENIYVYEIQHQKIHLQEITFLIQPHTKTVCTYIYAMH